MTNNHFEIKKKHQNLLKHIIRKLTGYVVKQREVSKREANYYFGIKITLKFAQTHRSIGNSQARLLE